MADENGIDLDALSASLGAAGASLRAFADGAARQASEDVGASFERAGERIARALTQAGASGEASFKKLAQVALEELAKIVVSDVFNLPGESTGNSQARAGSSLNDAFGAFFDSGGATSAAPVTVNFHMSGADASTVQRNSNQIAAQVARAVALGRRNL